MSPISEYISGFPEPVQSILSQIRTLISQIAPEATETISYAIPTFKLHGKNMVHFAGYKNHIGFYPTPGVLEAFADKLSGYETSKGAVKFSLKNEVPLDLIRAMTKYRFKEMTT